MHKFFHQFVVKVKSYFDTNIKCVFFPPIVVKYVLYRLSVKKIFDPLLNNLSVFGHFVGLRLCIFQAYL